MAGEQGGTGGCLCGAVRYRYQGAPLSTGLCQCTRCQRQSGSAFLIGVVFPSEAVAVQGELRSYVAAIDGGNRLWRHFCPNCGSAIMITLDRYPAIRSMMGGTLDDKTAVRPAFSVWTSEGQKWLTMPEGVECYAEYPDGTFGG